MSPLKNRFDQPCRGSGDDGFTLGELLALITILGVMAAIVAISVSVIT